MPIPLISLSFLNTYHHYNISYPFELIGYKTLTFAKVLELHQRALRDITG